MVVASSQVAYRIFNLLGTVTAVVLSCSYLLSVNGTLFKLILQTFDFWFKMYNLFVYLILSIYIRSNMISTSIGGGNKKIDNLDASTWGYSIFTGIATFLIFFWMFLLDATLLSTTTKNVSILLLCFYFSYYGFVVYFTIDDMNWNPFSSYNNVSLYTNINVKLLFISALLNMEIFILKPMIGVLARSLKRRLCCKTTLSILENNNMTELQECRTIYKRPTIKWKNIDWFKFQVHNGSAQGLEMHHQKSVENLNDDLEYSRF